VDTQERAVRLHVYQRLIEDGAAPRASAVAGALKIPDEQAQAVFERLADAHVLVLDPTTREIAMAMPFSATPTAFRVRDGMNAWWACCAWDGLGFAPMLDRPVEMGTRFADSGEPLLLQVPHDRPPAGDAVVHFAVPAAQWWDDITFT
jgi:hypothetical protein